MRILVVAILLFGVLNIYAQENNDCKKLKVLLIVDDKPFPCAYVGIKDDDILDTIMTDRNGYAEIDNPFKDQILEITVIMGPCFNVKLNKIE